MAPRLSTIGVVVSSAAPLACGREVEVLVVRGIVLVRDLETSVLYGGSGVLEKAGSTDVIVGWSDDYLQPRLAPKESIERQFRGRVVSCVVANVRQSGGEREVATSLVLEVDDGPKAPYRTP